MGLDASFKLREARDPGQILDVYGSVSFDYDAYYHALDAGYVAADGISRRDKNPLEIYEEQILAHLRATAPGKTLADVSIAAPIHKVDHGLLPASLPYAVVAGSVESFASVADHDQSESPGWSKRLDFAIVFDGSITLSGPSISLAELSTRRLTLSYSEDGGGAGRQVLRLGGETKFTVITGPSAVLGSGPVEIGRPFDLLLTLDGPPAAQPGESAIEYEVEYPNMLIGGYFLIATGGETSNWSQVHRCRRGLRSRSHS